MGSKLSQLQNWISPEVITPWTINPPLDFSDIGPFVNGFRSYSSGKIFRQLTPRLFVTSPTPISICTDSVIFVSISSEIPEPTKTGTEVVAATTTIVRLQPRPPSSLTQVPTRLSACGVRVTLSGAQTAHNIPTGDIT